MITPKSGSIKLGLDQRVFLRILVRFPRAYCVFPRGYGKCVSEDTNVLTDDGIVEIGDYFDIDEDSDETYLITENLKVQTQNGHLEEVAMGVYSGVKDTLIIETEEGHEIEVSHNHPLLTKSRWFNKQKWKRAKKLKVGQSLIMTHNTQVWGKCDKLTENNARILGKRWRTENEKIPKIVLKSNLKTVLIFLNELFNVENIEKIEEAITFNTTNRKLTNQLMTLLLNLGFRPTRTFNGEYFTITIPPIDIKCEGGQFFETKIKSITPSQNRVYDLSVPNTNSFVGNGFVNHNTFIEVLALIITAILYPGINLSMTAQTREAACGLIEDKFNEIMEWYPMLADCVEYKSFSKDKALIVFKNNSRITNLANHQSSKGKRRHRKLFCDYRVIGNGHNLKTSKA